MPELNLNFAKIVATPTTDSWSQVYNAGGLFAVLSLFKTQDPNEEKTLGVLGKEILNSLEEEYFTLETKNLKAIKQAIAVTAKKIPEDVIASFIIISVIDNVLYAFILGDGKIILKRGEKLGLILSQEVKNEIVSASGFLENDDIVILETPQFARLIPNQLLKDSLDHNPPSEIAESLSPKIHGEEEGGAAALIIAFKKPISPISGLENLEKEEAVVQKESPQEPSQFLEKIKNLKNNFSFLNIIFGKIRKYLKISNFTSNLTHSKKIFLTIAFILLIIFLVSIYLAIKKRDDAKTKDLFAEIYPVAEKKYNEGQSLIGLNENLAREDFKEAQKILNEGKTKFQTNSKEEKQIAELLAKLDAAINSSANAFSVTANEVSSDANVLLNTEKSKNVDFVTSDDKYIYFLNDSGVFVIDKKTNKEKQIIKKNWTDVFGLGVFLGNVYILDKKSSQVLKFVSADGGFSKNDYFASGVSPDLSQAVSMTIDGSIWILLENGTIKRFTKGKPNNFTISSLDKNFSKPTRIFTNASLGRIYILDNGNSRIVVFNKEGAYLEQYQTKILKEAKDLEVSEKDKKIFILSQNKIYEIGLK